MPDANLKNKQVVMIVPPENFRDEELFIPRDYLAGLGVEVLVASQDLVEAKGAKGGSVFPDLSLSEIDVKTANAIVLVGGTGASIYWDDAEVHQIIQEAVAEGDIVAAICIAPVTLGKAGVLKGKRATVSASEAVQLEAAGATYTNEDVTVDGKIITASSPAAAQKFAQAIAKKL